MMSTSDAYSAYSNYRIKWASLPWETDEALALRRRVFCDEQAIFDQDDRDAIDESAHLLVALGCTGGWYEQVVGRCVFTNQNLDSGMVRVLLLTQPSAPKSA